MAFTSTHYREATITGASGAGTNYPLPLEVFYNGRPIDSLALDTRSSTDVNAFQGVATDGTYYYTTDSTNIYKYTVSGSTWTLDSSRSVTSDNPTGKTQINSIDIKSGILYIGANDFTGGSSTAGWIIEYNASDLTPTGTYHSVGTATCEGGAWLGDEFFVVYHDTATIERYNSSFTLQASYTQTDSVLYGTRTDGWWQGATFIGNIILVHHHVSGYTGTPHLEGFQYRPSADDFVRVFSFPQPTANSGQDVFYDSANEQLLLAERNGGGAGVDTVALMDITFRPGVDMAGALARTDLGDVVITNSGNSAIAGDGTGYRETTLSEAYSLLWFKHPSDLGSNQAVRVHYGASGQTWSDAGLSSFADAYSNFETNTVEEFSNSFSSGSATVITTAPTPWSGTYALSKDGTGGDGVYSTDNTFINANTKRFIAYAWQPNSASGIQLSLMRVVSGSTVRRSNIKVDNTDIEVLDSGVWTTLTLDDLDERWLRVEGQYDYTNQTVYWEVRLGDNTRQLVGTHLASTDDVSRTYRDVLFYQNGDIDNVFSLTWNGQGSEPVIGTFGAAQVVSAGTNSKGVLGHPFHGPFGGPI